MNIILGSVASSINISAGVVFDIDALNYIQAVEVADGQILENPVKTAINTLVVGLKTDGIWSNISACGILAGARTLSGALIPLKGPAPTNFNFVSGDYTRSGGLSGDGFTKYINTNIAANSRPSNSAHISVYVSNSATLPNIITTQIIIGTGLAGSPVSGVDNFYILKGTPTSVGGMLTTRFGIGQTSTFTNQNRPGFKGISRTDNSVTYVLQGSLSSVVTRSSILPIAPWNILLYTGNSQLAGGNGEPGPPLGFIDTALTFYSIGSAVNLNLLQTRILTLMQTLSTLI